MYNYEMWTDEIVCGVSAVAVGSKASDISSFESITTSNVPSNKVCMHTVIFIALHFNMSLCSACQALEFLSWICDLYSFL